MAAPTSAPSDNHSGNSVAVMALKSCEEDIIDCLEDADLEKLAKQGQEIRVILPKVRERLERMDSNVFSVSKVRYLLLHANKQLDVNSRLFAPWLKVLEKHGVKPVTIGKLRQACNGTDESHGAVVLGKRPPIQFQGTCLFQRDISCLVELLANVSSKWYNIGMALNIPHDTLKQLNALMITFDGTVCLGRVLSEWIECKHADAKAPTVENLKTALRSKTVGLGDVACEVEDHFQNQEIPPAKKPSLDTVPSDTSSLEIVSQSCDAIVAEDKCTLLEVQVASQSDSVVSYQWMKDGSPLEEGDEFQGVNEPILSVANASLAIAGMCVCEISSSESPSSSLSSEPIQVVVTSLPLKKILIERYSDQPGIPEDSWPPVSNDTYINLALVKQGSVAGGYTRSTIQGDIDDIIGDKVSIEYESAFTDLEDGTRLLIEGRPGSGKTTLVHKFSQDWARGSSKLNLKNIKLLFLVHLRGFLSDPNITLRDIVQRYCVEYSTQESLIDNIVQYATEHNGKGLCFVLDGLDEYSPSSKKSIFVFHLIKKEKFPRAVVIVASRPAASARFRKVATKHIEVVGFLKEQIFEYVESYNFEQSEGRSGLHTYLDQHPNVRHMCYLPIHTAMVCYLYDVMGSKLPRTETKMYTEFTKHTLLRTFRREEDDEIDYLESPDDLPAEEKDWFKKICELAFEKTKLSKQVMFKSEVQEFFNDVSSGKDSLGLITVDRMARTCGFENLYTFLHLTFQEYLAAYHISKLEKEKLEKVLKDCSKKKHMQVVWKFYCGLVEFNKEEEFASLMDSTCLKRDDDLFCIQCAFELQQSIACDYVVKSGALSFTNHFLTPSDFTAIGYAIYHGTHPVTKLTFNKCNLSIEGIIAFSEEVKEKIAVITTLCFHHKACVTEQLMTLKLLLIGAASLKVLDISDINLGPKKIQQLTENLRLLNLTTVILTPPANLDKASLKLLTFGSSLQQFVFHGDIPPHLNDVIHDALREDKSLYLRSVSTLPNVAFHQILCAGEAEIVFDGLKHLSCCISLDLAGCYIGNNGCQYLADGLMCCTELQALILCNNEIGDSGVQHLVKIFSTCMNIKKLDLEVNNIGDAGAIAIAETAQSCTKLCALNLGYNFICDAGALALAESIPCLTDLEQLQMNCNRIGDEGAIAVTKAVSSSCKLEIWNHRISQTGAEMIVHSLMCNVDRNFHDFSIGDEATSIPMDVSFKHIWFNILGDTDAINYIKVLNINHHVDPDYKRIFTFIKKCSHIRILNFEDNLFSTTDLTIIMDGIKNCCHLQVLNLVKNGMGMTPMCFTQLARGLELPKAYNLLTLNLGYNLIGINSVAPLVDALKHCRTLQSLGLECNEIGRQDGALVLSECFSYLPNLLSLNLHSNNISTGAPVLIDALKHCKNLTALNLGNNNIDCKNVAHLCHTIDRNSFGISGAEAIANFLRSACNLQSLNLEGNSLGTSGVIAVVGALVHCNNIHELDFAWNGIGPNSAPALASFLTSSNSLQSLSLNGNHLGAQGMQTVLEGLRTCEDLQTVHLGHTDMGSHCAGVIIDSLKCWSNLQTLGLEDCKITSIESEVLADNLALGFCPRLETLILDANIYNIHHKSFSELITKGLKHCANLRVLSLKENYVGDDGAMALAVALKSHKHLHTLNLENCGVNNDGKKALTASLQQCKNIKV